MSAMHIRRARRSDVVSIVDLLARDPLGQQRESPGQPLDPAYERAFDAVDADPNALIVVIEHGDQIVGCCQINFIVGLSRRGMVRGQIEGVRVDASYRGQGLGRTLIEWAIEACRKRNCGLVQLTTDKSRQDAHEFYEGLGFTASHAGMKLSLH